MLTITLCLLGLVALLFVSEHLGRRKILGPEPKRKVFHIVSGSFIAFWPWLMSPQAIEIIGVAMALSVIANYSVDLFDFNKGIGRRSYGDFFMALAVSLSAYLAPSKIVFALALLNLAMADGVAALVGKRFGANWQYKVFSQTKTVIGTMAFWLVSLVVSAVVLIFARQQLEFNNYLELIVIMPPVLAALENFSFLGLDNLTVPLAAIAIFSLIA